MEESTEALILEALQTEASLKTVNNYGENLLHVAAANGCSRIIKEILEKEKIFDINRRNVFGWTPLMQAIRNGKIDCVKILLANGASVSESTYLGTSAIGLATAVGREMFEAVYKACPSALEIASRDEVCPLSITAMKNDKDLFFRLLQLGLNVSKANTFAHFMMKSSLIPEISALAKPPQNLESYWNDCSDNIEILDELKNHSHASMPITKKKPDLPRICVQEFNDEYSRPNASNNKTEELSLIIPCDKTNSEYKSLISPNLTYNVSGAFLPSPGPIFPDEEEKKRGVDNKNAQDLIFFTESFNISNSHSDSNRSLHRCQKIRPPDLEFVNEARDLNNSLSFIPEYSPTKSPNVPPEIENENAVFGETTPTPPHGAPPPKAFILTSRDAPMAFLLHSYGLSRFMPIFLEQEVDVELFKTLNNEDLKEIGIEREIERRILLSAIDEFKKTGAFL